MRKQISKILDQIQAHRSDEASELEDVATRRKELVRLPLELEDLLFPRLESQAILAAAGSDASSRLRDFRKGGKEPSRWRQRFP